MRRRRVRPIGIDELVCRGRQEAAKWLERTGTITQNGAGLHHALDVERVRVFGARRFFEGAVSERTPRLLIDRMPAARDEVLSVADAVCSGSFDLLGYSRLHFGEPVDWHLDPISGRRAPIVHWSRLDPLDAGVVGDHKVVWELNRHQWMVRLGQAYRLTGDLRYARAFAAYLRQWMDANPPGMGINWASSLEVALRLISWCWSLLLFRGSPVLSHGLFAEILKGIWVHANHVERYLSYYFSPNTHLTGEALGLFYAGLLLPDLPLSERWRTLGARILVDQSERQVLPDGVYFEQSTGYARYTLEIYLHFLILGAQNAWPIRPTIAERIGRMLDFLLTMRSPDGSMPQIGDADSGSLLPLARRVQDDFRGVFATAAALFGRADCALAAGAATPEVLWLLGPTGLRAFDALRPAPPPSTPSQLFADGGYVVMRNGWGPDGHRLIFDVGPLGCPVSGGHGHADLLSVQCAVFGEPFLVDGGTYSYVDPPNRDFFRSAAAHSTVMVDGEPLAAPTGPFRWRERPAARLRRWLSTAEFDLADAEHGAYLRLPDAVLHRRRVLFVKSGYWVLVDDLAGNGEHGVELRFQFAPIGVEVDPTLWTRARGRRGGELLVRPFANVSLKASVHSGEFAPLQGWTSPEYGRRQPSPVLIYSTVTRLPLRIITLLLPTLNHAAAPAVAPLVGEDGVPTGVVFEGSGESVSFGDLGVLLTGRGRDKREQ